MSDTTKVDYIVISGSQLYGTQTDMSDIDIRGFVFPSTDELLGLTTNSQVQQIKNSLADMVLHKFPHFFKSLVKGNTQTLEMLFVSPEYILVDHDAAKLLREQVHLFVTKKCLRHLQGFLLSEYRKATCQEITIKDPSGSGLVYNIESACSSLGLKRFEREQVIKYLEELSGQSIIGYDSTLDKVGEARREDFERFGYCRKNAYHAIRLLYQGIDLLQSRRMSFPLHGIICDQLLSIRAGSMRVDEWQHTYDTLSDMMNELIITTDMPDSVDTDRVNALYKYIVLRYGNIDYDARFIDRVG